MKRNEDSLRDLWNSKQTKIQILRIPEEEEKNLRKYVKRL